MTLSMRDRLTIRYIWLSNHVHGEVTRKILAYIIRSMNNGYLKKQVNAVTKRFVLSRDVYIKLTIWPETLCLSPHFTALLQ